MYWVLARAGLAVPRLANPRPGERLNEGNVGSVERGIEPKCKRCGGWRRFIRFGWSKHVGKAVLTAGGGEGRDLGVGKAKHTIEQSKTIDALSFLSGFNPSLPPAELTVYPSRPSVPLCVNLCAVSLGGQH